MHQAASSSGEPSLRAQLAASVHGLLDSDAWRLGLPAALGLSIAALAMADSVAAADLGTTAANDLLLGGASPSPSAPLLIGDIAENEDFWANVLRYAQYFFSVLLGTAYVAVKPFIELFKRPVTAVIGVGLAVGLYVAVSVTVKAMLGLDSPLEPNYMPGSIVTPTSSPYRG